MELTLKNRSPAFLKRLNIALSLLIPIALVCLLVFASHASLLVTILIGVVFSFVFLTNYALMHEAAHSVLHPNPTWNHLMGSFVGWHFPMSCRFLTITHLVHHRCNRTDHEMFDYYYEGDNRLVKICQWYGILLGFHYLIVPIGCVIVAVLPKRVITGVAHHYRSSGVLFDDFTGTDINRIRLEVIGFIVYWLAMWQLFSLDLVSTAILFGMAGFHWSTRQYLTHAFTPRDVRHGAIILKSNPLMQMILLNGNYDLVHHLHPRAPWTQLERLAPADVEHTGFWGQYLNMWKGPRPCPEPAPLPE